MMKVFTPWNSAMLLNRPYPREPVFKPFLAHHWSFQLTTQYCSIWVLLHFPSHLLLLETTDGILSRHSYPTTHTLPDLSAWDRVSWVHLPSPPNHGYLFGSEWFQILFLVSFNHSVSFPLPSNVSISPDCESSLLLFLPQPAVYCLFFLIAQV